MHRLDLKERVLFTWVVAALLAAFAAPSLASAVPGDSWDDPFPVAATFSTPVTISSVPFWMWYSISASAGQTVRVQAAMPGTDAWIAMGTFDDPSYTIEGSYVGPSLLSLTFMAPHNQAYLLAVSSDSTGPCTVSGMLVAPQPFALKSMSAPGSVKHGKSCTVSVKTYPAYNSLSSPIKFVVQRKSGKKWKAYGSAPGKFTAQFLSGGSSKSTASLKFAKRGTYRVRARFMDAAHPTASYSAGWKTIKVK